MNETLLARPPSQRRLIGPCLDYHACAVEPNADASRIGGTTYVLLPVHDRKALTERFAKQLAIQTDPDYRLILLDDGSSDGTAEVVRAVLPSVVTLRGRGDWWWAGALQVGRNWLRRQALNEHDVVLIANDDMQIGPDFLATGRAVLSRNPRSLVLAQLHREDGSLEEVGAHIDWWPLRVRGVTEPELVNCFSTRGLFVRATEFLEIGAFHPRLLPHYASDYEFTLRAVRKGFALRTDQTLQLTHSDDPRRGAYTAADGVGEFVRQRLAIRNIRNPLYRTTFLLLACPARYVPANVIRIWGRFVFDLLSAARP